MPKSRELSDERLAVAKEALISCAEIVQAWLAIRGMKDSILRTSPVAKRQDLAAETETGQTIPFGVPEGSLCRALKKIDQRSLLDVAQAVPSIDEVVARKDVSVMFDHRNIATGFSEDAERVFIGESRSGYFLKDLHLDPLDIQADPLIEDGTEKIAPCFGWHGSVTYRVLSGRFGFDQRQKVDVLSLDLLKKTVNL